MNQDITKTGNDFVVGSTSHVEIEKSKKTLKDYEKILKDSNIVYTWSSGAQLFAKLKKGEAEGTMLMELRIYVDEPSNDIVADILHGLKRTSRDKYKINPQDAIIEFISRKSEF